MPFKIVRNDITKMEVDAIVNTANPAPVYSAGTDSAVYKAAGAMQLLEERKKIGYMEEGEVAITYGFQLPAKYIIHAVSPIYKDGESGEETKLRSCYRKSLMLALENRCKSIAFPLISTGSFGYPKEEGMRIAVDEINGFLLKHEMLVYLVVFDNESTRLGMSLYPDLKSYIDQHYVQEKKLEEYPGVFRNAARMPELHYDIWQDEGVFSPGCQSEAQPCMVCESIDYNSFVEEAQSDLKERVLHTADTFQEYLFYLIKTKKLKNSEVYKRAIVTKQLFSKIKQNPDYHPDKSTAIRLCVGAKLNLDETKDLLARAGYALSPCDKRDIIFTYFIEHGIYDMIEIDIVLEEFGLPCFIE